MRTVTRALVAGATGTTALNTVTYLDMALRARPASSTPEQSVQKLSEATHVGLGEDGKADNRKAGIGPLLGYATGLGAAVGYAYLLRRLGRRPPWPVSAVALSALAMVGANAPMVVTGVTNPRRWSAADWAADVVPHLAYGTAAAAALHKATAADGAGPGRRMTGVSRGTPPAWLSWTAIATMWPGWRRR
jgi:hypothetical protein